MNRKDCAKSEFDKLIAYKKCKAVDTTNKIKDYLKKSFKDMKCVNAVSQREKRAAINKEIAQAVKEIN